MKKSFLVSLFLLYSIGIKAQTIPLPEHPRPDFERSDWVNLNGKWEFEFDSLGKGEAQNWQKGRWRTISRGQKLLPIIYNGCRHQQRQYEKGCFNG